MRVPNDALTSHIYANIPSKYMLTERFGRRILPKRIAQAAGTSYISQEEIDRLSQEKTDKVILLEPAPIFTPDPSLTLQVRSLTYHNIKSLSWLVNDVMTARQQGFRPIRQQDSARRIAGDPDTKLIPLTDGKRLAVFIDDSWKDHFIAAKYLVDQYPKRVKAQFNIEEELEVILAVITKLGPKPNEVPKGISLAGPEGPLNSLPLNRKLYPDTGNMTYGTVGDCLEVLGLKNILFQSHLPDHPHLRVLDQKGINSQLDTGVERILSFYSLAKQELPQLGVVYPYGEYNSRVLDHMAFIEAGMKSKDPNVILVGYSTEAGEKLTFENRHHWPREHRS